MISLNVCRGGKPEELGRTSTKEIIEVTDEG